MFQYPAAIGWITFIQGSENSDNQPHNHSDSRSFFYLSAKSSRQPSRAPRANSIENVIVEEVCDTEQEFDFETFHKNINQQKAKSVKVKQTWS